MTAPLSFNQLNFSQFVGGECRTILQSESSVEMQGRLRILSKIAYLYDQCRSWEKARATYFAILSSIEECEADWASSFGHYDVMCPPVGDENVTAKTEFKPKNRIQQKRDFYCREFQKGECTMQSPP